MKRVCNWSWVLAEFLLSQECRIWLRLALKPLAVLAVLALFLWLGAWFDTQIANHIAHAESTEIQVLACPPGTEQSGELCYPLCQHGFTGNGPVCDLKCPSGYIDDGSTCRRDAIFFFKPSYGRGAGSPMVCAANQEAQGGLCYPRCAPTHYGVGPVCWERCKAGYTDHGATCFKHLFDWYGKNTYGRGAGVGVSTCPAGMERNGALCYPKCRAGFYGEGPVCYQRCPPEHLNSGFGCRRPLDTFTKVSYARGAGEAMNFVPEAIDETVQTPKDTPVALAFAHVDADELSSKPPITVRDFLNGRLIGNTYTPNSGFEGVDAYHWKVNDGKHDSNVAIVTIIVGNVDPNSAPVALDRTVAVTEETPITIDVLCTDAENDELFYQLLEKPKHGEYQWIPPNTVIYTPTVDFVGTDSFTFRSHDGQDSSNVSTITLTVNAVNDAPVIVTQPISTTRNNNAAVVLAATDVESDTITYTVVASPTYGSLSGEIPNLTYTPNADFVGEDNFQFRASDAHGAASVAAIAITVLPTNTAPVAENLALSTTQESAVAVNLTATDANGDALTYRLVSSPTHGSLTGVGTDWIYTPKANFTGVESFTFTANDGQADAPVATVTITVSAGPNEASVAGLVFDDRNGNGQPDAEESGAAGLLVTLTPTNGRTDNAFSATTEVGGGWRIDNVPFGAYTVKVTGGNGVQIEQPVETTVTVGQRGLQQMQPGAVKVTGRTLFLPVVVR
ncbi:MAG: tandem-95 repeat protein [Caldilinea sp. CFX5]|nr:tandem-95 repeat protein [Caldilinea sp. CFX5]